MNSHGTEHGADQGPRRRGLSRRELLAQGSRATLVLAGVAELAGIAGCGGRHWASDVHQLGREVSGPVLVPGDRGYERATLLFNPSFDGANPRAVAFCRTPQGLWAECAPEQCARRAANPYKIKSAFFAEPLPAAGIRTAIEQLERRPATAASSPAAGIELNSWGGAIARVPGSATAFVHRDARFLAIYSTTWSTQDGPGAVAANRAWLEQLYAQMRPYASGYAYQNLIDPQLSDWAHAYYGSNLARLAEIKRRYDPEDVFHFAQGIPVRS